MGHHTLDLYNSFSNIILAQKDQCQKVIFDLRQLKKVDKLRSEYHIPPEETILAFCKSPVALFSMATEGLIFTNEALYFCPGHTLKNGIKLKRILYTTMDSYIFTQEGSNGVVHAQTLNDEIRIIGPGPIFASHNIAGTEIRKILREIQNHLFKQSPLAKSRFDALAVAFLKKLRAEMGILEIRKRTDAILYSLMKFPDHADAAAMLKAEYLFREFLPEKYEKYAATLPRIISKNTREEIINIPESFPNNYIRTLRQLDNDYKYEDLLIIYQRISGHEWKDVDTTTICAYLSIRMNGSRKLNAALSVIRKRDGDAAVNSIEYFKGIHSYHLMWSVYSAIKKGEKLHPAYTHFRDGVGLTPLHYAILLKNEKAIADMLKKQNWTQAAPIGPNTSFESIYNYIVPAFGKQLSCFDDILLGTNKDAIKLKNDIKSRTKTLKFQNVVLSLNKVCFSTQRADYLKKQLTNANDDELDVLRDDLENTRCSLENAASNAEDSVNILEEYLSELAGIVDNAPSETAEILNKATYSDDPLVRYLYRLYFEPDFFEQVLLATQNSQPMNLYVHKGFYFVAPEFAEINLPPLEVQSSQKKTTEKTEQKKKEVPRNTPIYRNSWFSPKAHRDADILKSEYRKLAKQYHPDVSDMEDSTRLFQNISAEYKDLLEGLN